MAQANLIKKLGDRIRNSGFIVPIYNFVIWLCLAIVIISVRDFYTSYRGVLATMPPLPATATGFERALMTRVSPFAVALVPQAVIGVSLYAILAIWGPQGTAEKSLWGMAVVSLAGALYVDIGTGYAYYMPDGMQGIPLTAQTLRDVAEVRHAVFHALVIDTLFSEAWGTVAFGLLWELRADFNRQLGWGGLPKLSNSMVPGPNINRQPPPGGGQGQGQRQNRVHDRNLPTRPARPAIPINNMAGDQVSELDME
jgi:hypothetical protein